MSSGTIRSLTAPGLSPRELRRLTARLMADEGFAGEPYECPEDRRLGRLTVGFGTLLPFEAHERTYLAARRKFWPTKDDSVLSWSQIPHSVFPISRVEGFWLLEGRAAAAAADLCKALTGGPGLDWRSAPADLRVALADMAYQLGVAGVLGFDRMIGALIVKDYPEAADEALDSAWARETPKRAERIAALIRGAQ